MPQYLSPGVYIEEFDTGSVPIEGVSTSTAGFIGPTERGPIDPQLITSFADYRRTFGDSHSTRFGEVEDPQQSYLMYAVDGYFKNGGSRCYVARVTAGEADTAETEVGDVTVRATGPGAWGNNVTVDVTETKTGDRFDVLVRYWAGGVPEDTEDPDVEDPVEERYANLDATKGSPDYYAKNINDASNLVEVTEGAADLLPADTYTLDGGEDGDPLGLDDFEKGEDITVERPSGEPKVLRAGLKGFTEVDEISIVCAPDEAKVTGLTEAIRNHCESKELYRFAVLQAGRGVDPGALDGRGLESSEISDRGYAAFYYPWIKVLDPLTNVETLVPPGGHVAGVYARTDQTRGVHKAPANEVLNGVQGLEHEIRKVDQDGLNPQGINCIRAFRGRGIRVWGARTTSPNTRWRYVNVRRLFLFIEESIDEGTQWAVFEPNDEPLWARVRQSVTAFLTGVWRDGALQGTTPEEAFYVKCDRTTMTQDDIDKGRLIVEIGVAPVKPAEFVIFRITQWTAGAEGA